LSAKSLVLDCEPMVQAIYRTLNVRPQGI
jgi:hypothetical protein